MIDKFQTTEIGDFPLDWKIDRVDSAFEIQQGKQVSKKNRIGDNQHPFLRTKNISWNHINLAELDQMNFTKAEEVRFELQPNDLLVCEGGDIGRTARWSEDIQECYYQNHLHRLRALNDQVDAQFSVYWFWYAFQIAKLYFGRGNTTTIPNLSRSRLAELPMVLPPLPEQKKIAHILSTVQRAIEAQERIIQTTTKLFKSMLHQLMTAQIKVSDEHTVKRGFKELEHLMKVSNFQLPTSWYVCSIGETYDFTKKPHGLNLRKNGNEVPFFPMDRISSGQIYASDFIIRSVNNLGSGTYVENQDLMVAKITPSFENGKQGIVDIDADFAYATTEVIPIRGVHGKSDTLFLFFYLLHPEIRAKLAGKMEGSTGRQRLNKAVLGDCSLPLPPLPAQQQIAHILSTVQKKIDKAQAKKAKLQDLFRALLHELMAARLRVEGIQVTNRTLKS